MRYQQGDELVRKYALAAYQHTAQGWLDQLAALRDRLAANPDLSADLNNIDLSFAERQARLDSVLPTDVQPGVRNFVYVLLREGDLNLLEDVIDDLTRLSTRGPEAQVGHIISAVPLTPDEKDAFRQKVQARFGSDIELDFRVDGTILGGVIVQVGDKIIDGSITGKLNALHERLVDLR